MRKLFLGTALRASCQECGKKIGLSYFYSLLAGLPFLAAILGAVFIDTQWLQLILVALGFCATALLTIYWAPLEPR